MKLIEYLKRLSSAKPLAWVRDFIFAPRAVCMGCQSVRGADDNWLCAECAARAAQLTAPKGARYCITCGAILDGYACEKCSPRAFNTLMTRAVYAYKPPIDNAIRAFKFRGTYRMDAWMGGEIAALASAAGMADADIVIGVPMHYLRKMRRGYNQADKLARVVASHIGKPRSNALKRTRVTRSQSKLKGGARLKNLEGAFFADARVSGKSVLLIDDVITTGTTAIKCAQALKQAGATRITLAAFASAQ